MMTVLENSLSVTLAGKKKTDLLGLVKQAPLKKDKIIVKHLYLYWVSRVKECFNSSVPSDSVNMSAGILLTS